MSNHGQIMRLSSIKSGHSGNPEIPQDFDFDLTCDVIGDLEVRFRISVCYFMYSLSICRLHFENPSVTFRDLREAESPPPPTGRRVRAHPFVARAKLGWRGLTSWTVSENNLLDLPVMPVQVLDPWRRH